MSDTMARRVSSSCGKERVMSLICDVVRPEMDCSLRVIDIGGCGFRRMVVFF